MIVHPADRNIVKWAIDHSSPCYYTREPDLPNPCLKVQCGHVTAYFCRGRLARLWAHADGDQFDDMFADMTQILRFFGHPNRSITARRI